MFLQSIMFNNNKKCKAWLDNSKKLCDRLTGAFMSNSEYSMTLIWGGLSTTSEGINCPQPITIFKLHEDYQLFLSELNKADPSSEGNISAFFDTLANTTKQFNNGGKAFKDKKIVANYDKLIIRNLLSGTNNNDAINLQKNLGNIQKIMDDHELGVNDNQIKKELWPIFKREVNNKDNDNKVNFNKINFPIFKNLLKEKLKKLPKKLRKNLKRKDIKPAKITLDNYRDKAAQYVSALLEYTRTKPNCHYGIKDHREYLSPVVNEIAVYDKELQTSIKEIYNDHLNDLNSKGAAIEAQHITWFPVEEMPPYCADIRTEVDQNREARNLNNIITATQKKIETYLTKASRKSTDRKQLANTLLDNLKNLKAPATTVVDVFKIINATIEKSIKKDKAKNNSFFRKIMPFLQRNPSLTGSRLRCNLLFMQQFLITSCPNELLQELQPLLLPDKHLQSLLKRRLEKKDVASEKDLEHTSVSTTSDINKIMEKNTIGKSDSSKSLDGLIRKNKNLDNEEKLLLQQPDKPPIEIIEITEKEKKNDNKIGNKSQILDNIVCSH